jgi:nickel transport protein
MPIFSQERGCDLDWSAANQGTGSMPTGSGWGLGTGLVMEWMMGLATGLVIGLLVISLCAPPVIAHDLWLAREGHDLIIQYGHVGASHTGAGSIEYLPDQILRVDCFEAEGTALPVETNQEYPVRIRGLCAVTCVLFSTGYWTRTPFGTKNLPKDEVKSPLESWRSLEAVKRIDSWTDNLAQPLTYYLELTPREDPLVLDKGEKIRLLVTLRGEPVQGAAVSYAGKLRGESDRKGQINIKLKQSGLQFIQASFTEPATGEAALKTDKIVRTATLVFELNADD